VAKREKKAKGNKGERREINRERERERQDKERE
jgi:hypothetical protein